MLVVIPTPGALIDVILVACPYWRKRITPTDRVPNPRCTIASNIGINLPIFKDLLHFPLVYLQESLPFVVFGFRDMLSFKEALQCL